MEEDKAVMQAELERLREKAKAAEEAADKVSMEKECMQGFVSQLEEELQNLKKEMVDQRSLNQVSVVFECLPLFLFIWYLIISKLGCYWVHC